MAVWEVAKTNHPKGLRTCEVCERTRWFHETYRMRFAGMAHRVGTTKEERRKHGPGLWVCAQCRGRLEGEEAKVEFGLLVIGRRTFALEAAQPEQTALW